MLSPKKTFSNYLNIRKLHPVAIDNREEWVRVFFKSEGAERDITDHHALVSLKPFAIAVNAFTNEFSNPKKATLIIRDDEKILGELNMEPNVIKRFNDFTLSIYEATLAPHSISYFNQIWNSLLLTIKNNIDKKSKNFIVPPQELLKLFVYSLKPRPVFLISVAHEKGFDVFPIDIIGKVSKDHILLSIRSTSAVIPHILTEKKLCASAVPFSKRTEVYKLGRHHAGGMLPEGFDAVKFIPSKHFQIPIPDFAIDILELTMENSFTKGVHTTFLTRIEHSYPLSGDQQLAHTPWFNRMYFNHRFEPIK